MYEIQIYPIKRLYQIAMEADLQACAGVLVSSYEIDSKKLPGLTHLLTMQFDDITAPNQVNSFHENYAIQIKSFIDSLPKDLDTLFVCCDSGESRSSAIASAIMRYLGIDDSIIWKNPKYHPNPRVYTVLCEALGILISNEELDKKLFVNKQAFSNRL